GFHVTGVQTCALPIYAASGTSRPSILRFDVTGTGSELVATNEWNLAADLATDVPTIGANSGLEGITWIPDAVLTARGFADESTGAAYDPAAYPNHRTGVFFVALAATGDVYAYVLHLTRSSAPRGRGGPATRPGRSGWGRSATRGATVARQPCRSARAAVTRSPTATRAPRMPPTARTRDSRSRPSRRASTARSPCTTPT